MAADAKSSSSSESDYIKDDAPQPRSPRLPSRSQMLREVKQLPTSDGLEIEWERKGLLSGLGRSNSCESEVPLEDIRTLNAPHVRKPSCFCQFCGGPKLAKAMEMVLLLRREKKVKERDIKGVKGFGTLIKDYKSDKFKFPTFLSLKSSKLRKQKIKVIYTRPPITPALKHYLESSPPLPPSRPTTTSMRKSSTSRSCRSIAARRRPQCLFTAPCSKPHSPLVARSPTFTPYTSPGSSFYEARTYQKTLRRNVQKRLMELGAVTSRYDLDRLFATDKTSAGYPKVPPRIDPPSRPFSTSPKAGSFIQFPVRPF